MPTVCSLFSGIGGIDLGFIQAGFPKEFRFPKISMASAYKQCGNSVVVPVIRRIAERIYEVMKDE